MPINPIDNPNAVAWCATHQVLIFDRRFLSIVFVVRFIFFKIRALNQISYSIKNPLNRLKRELEIQSSCHNHNHGWITYILQISQLRANYIYRHLLDRFNLQVFFGSVKNEDLTPLFLPSIFHAGAESSPLQCFRGLASQR